jgi:hypothetical protein
MDVGRLKGKYLRMVSPMEPLEDARRRPICRWSRSMARWSPAFSLWNVFGPARQGEGSRARGSDRRSWSSLLDVCVGFGLTPAFCISLLGSIRDVVLFGSGGGGASVASCQPSKKAPSSVSSRAAAFSAAGVFGDVRRVCCFPMLTPIADCAVSSPNALSSGDSSSEGVRSSSTIEAN